VPVRSRQASGGDGRFRHEVLAVVFQVRDDRLHVLLWQRAREPFMGRWALPGGPLGVDERLGTSLGRHLAAKVDITDIAHLEQLETRSDPERDPRERELATAYLALVSTAVNPAVPEDTAWHPVEDLPPTGFDHASIIGSARGRLRAKLTYSNIGFALAPDAFTIAELRQIYAACLGHPVSATNLQRVLTRRQVIEPTSATVQRGPSGGRPATLYKFAETALVITHPFAGFRPPPRATRSGAGLRGEVPARAEAPGLRGPADPGAEAVGASASGADPQETWPSAPVS
jgi:ADP-ribose pyrophosphatase YjhB (NUDIX family)